jgi:hypothetical protein
VVRLGQFFRVITRDNAIIAAELSAVYLESYRGQEIETEIAPELDPDRDIKIEP